MAIFSAPSPLRGKVTGLRPFGAKQIAPEIRQIKAENVSVSLDDREHCS